MLKTITMHPEVKLDIEDLLEVMQLDNQEALSEYLIDYISLFGELAYAWVKMDKECKGRILKDPNDDDWDEDLYMEYRELEIKYYQAIIKSIKEIAEYQNA